MYKCKNIIFYLYILKLESISWLIIIYANFKYKGGKWKCMWPLLAKFLLSKPFFLSKQPSHFSWSDNQKKIFFFFHFKNKIKFNLEACIITNYFEGKVLFLYGVKYGNFCFINLLKYFFILYIFFLISHLFFFS